MIEVEIVYGNADKQENITLSLPSTATVEDAIKASKILINHPEIDLTQQKIGIFSKLVTLDTQIKNHDRIEIYRALVIDPKEARKLRLKKKA